MPITKSGIGISPITPQKQANLAKILGQHVSTCKAILAKHKQWANPIYQYIDTNAGCGYNLEIGCDGSPLVFLKAACRNRTLYNAHLIEINSDNSLLLSQAVEGYDNVTVITGNNRDHVHGIVRNLPKKSFGLFYNDPNGIPDFEMIARASKSRKMKHVDILIRYAASAVKRSQHISGKKMLDYLKMVNKKYWIVQEVNKSDRWQWTFLLGLNWNGYREWKSQGFHYAHSIEGQMIVEKLNYTNDELKDRQQLTLL